MADAPATPTTPVVPAATQAAAPVPGTPEHDAAMAAKFDATTTPAAAPAAAAEPVRPAGLPEKFKTVEDLVKSYGELEKKLGAPAEPVKPAATTEPAKPANSALEITPEQKAAAEATAKAGLDMTALSAEFAENGDLKPETYAKLAEGGIPKEMVDSYIAGQKAIGAQYTAEAFTTAGGEESYGKMVAWAKTGMSVEEQAAFNKAVTSNDKPQMKLAVAGLKARYEANFGSQPNLINGNTTTPSGDVYESMAQVTADMKKSEYRKDPAFRAKVTAKLDRSTIGRVTERAI